MPKTVPIDKIIQQLKTLSLAQLIEVKEIVEALIEKKLFSDISQQRSSSFGRVYHLVERKLTPARKQGLRELVEVNLSGSYSDKTRVFETNNLDADILVKLIEAKTGDVQFEEVDKEEESLQDVIELVDEWMSDESGYDEETYPQIEVALNQERVFL